MTSSERLPARPDNDRRIAHRRRPVIVDEFVITFTHTTMVDWLLPGVAPTGKPVVMAVAVVVGFKDGKISHEHIYWDQARSSRPGRPAGSQGPPVSGGEAPERRWI